MFRQLITQLFLIGVVGGAAACGPITVSEPKGSAQGGTNLEQAQDQGSGSGSGGESAPVGGTAADAGREAGTKNSAARAPASQATDVAVDVSVRVHVAPADAAADGDPAPDADVAGMTYEPRLRAWQAAKDAAPPGHRLATRGEVLALLDAGAFRELGHGGPCVWTATARGSDRIIVDLDNGQAVPEGVVLPLAAVYVRAGVTR